MPCALPETGNRKGKICQTNTKKCKKNGTFCKIFIKSKLCNLHYFQRGEICKFVAVGATNRALPPRRPCRGLRRPGPAVGTPLPRGAEAFGRWGFHTLILRPGRNRLAGRHMPSGIFKDRREGGRGSRVTTFGGKFWSQKNSAPQWPKSRLWRRTHKVFRSTRRGGGRVRQTHPPNRPSGPNLQKKMLHAMPVEHTYLWEASRNWAREE